MGGAVTSIQSRFRRQLLILPAALLKTTSIVSAMDLEGHYRKQRCKHDVAGGLFVLLLQLEDVQEALSSQNSSPAASHVRCIPADLPAGHVAVTVVATKRWSPDSTGPGGSNSSSGNTSAADGDTFGGAAAEDAALHDDHDQH